VHARSLRISLRFIPSLPSDTLSLGRFGVVG
jgi:hypothetical protein